MSPTVFQDNVSIPDEEMLFRRIHLTCLVLDEDTGLARVSSGAFRDTEMSVNIASTLAASGDGPATCLMGYPNHRLVALRSGDARSLGQWICRDPMQKDLSHGLVYGQKSRKTANDLRMHSAWEIPSIAPAYSLIEAEKKAAGL